MATRLLRSNSVFLMLFDWPSRTVRWQRIVKDLIMKNGHRSKDLTKNCHRTKIRIVKHLIESLAKNYQMTMVKTLTNNRRQRNLWSKNAQYWKYKKDSWLSCPGDCSIANGGGRRGKVAGQPGPWKTISRPDRFFSCLQGAKDPCTQAWLPLALASGNLRKHVNYTNI